jgi:hypothetical protein
MARVIKLGKIDADTVVDVLNNCKNICTEIGENAYTPARLFEDMANIVDVEDFSALVGRLRQSGKQAAGHRYELEIANFCKRSGGKALRFVSLAVEVVVAGEAQRTDIDVACEIDGKNILLQAKRSFNAFKKAKAGTKLTSVREWVAKARAAAKRLGYDGVGYAVPDEAIIPTRIAGEDKISVLRYIRQYTAGVFEIPHAPVPFE